MIKFPTQQEVQKSAQQRHCGAGEAENDLIKETLTRHLSNANSLEEVKEVISYLVSKL